MAPQKASAPDTVPTVTEGRESEQPAGRLASKLTEAIDELKARRERAAVELDDAFAVIVDEIDRMLDRKGASR
jgi:hypothetical protein